MPTLSIGRQNTCDIVVDDPTVSRRHADLSRLGEDLFLYVDRSSTSGSYRLVDREWKQFSNARLRGSDRVRLGSFETTIKELIGRGSRPEPEQKSEPRPRPQPELKPEPQPERRGSTYLERDPATGQLVTRTR